MISERRACELVSLSRTVLHYESTAQPENEQLQARLVELAGERRRFGYRRLHALVRREGVSVNHKRLYRLYSDAGLTVRRRKKRHGVAVERQALELPLRPNDVWSMDFVSDVLASGRRIKALTIVDDFSKESSLIQAGKPTQNAFIESFNGRFRDECLNDHWFTSLAEARILSAAWRRDYNQHRPHSALDYQTPAEFAATHRATKADQLAQEECF